MRDQAATLEPDPERAEALLVIQPPRLRQRERLGLGIPPLAEIPDALLAAPTYDGDLALGREDFEHQPHLALTPPAVVLAPMAGCVLDLAREQRAAFAKLAQNVAAKSGVLLEPFATIAIQRPI